MADAQRLAVCAGSFDPLTNGHLDIIARAARLFDRLVVVLPRSSVKRPWFTVEERLSTIQEVLASLPDLGHVEADTFHGLLTDYARRRQAAALIRGLRNVSEFSDESQMAMMNRHLLPGCDTIFLMAAPSVAHVSSRLVKEIAALGGPLDGLVPPQVAARLSQLRSADGTVRA
jgi:pantetheine-phosphate adenylyltransferase